MTKLLSIVIAGVLLAAGCGNKEEPKQPAPPQRPPVNQEESKKIPIPPPPLPGPTVPKIDASQSLRPTFAAAESVPAFDGGAEPPRRG